MLIILLNEHSLLIKIFLTIKASKIETYLVTSVQQLAITDMLVIFGLLYKNNIAMKCF